MSDAQKVTRIFQKYATKIHGYGVTADVTVLHMHNFSQMAIDLGEEEGYDVDAWKELCGELGVDSRAGLGLGDFARQFELNGADTSKTVDDAYSELFNKKRKDREKSKAPAVPAVPKCAVIAAALYIVHPEIWHRSLQILSCKQLGSGITTLHVLVDDPGVECYTSSHWRAIGVAIGALLLFGSGLPICFVCLNVRHQRRQQASATGLPLMYAITAGHRYRDGELLVTFRKLAMICIAVFLRPSGGIMQIICALVVTQLGSLLCWWLQPWLQAQSTAMETAAQYAHFMTLLCLLALSRSDVAKEPSAAFPPSLHALTVLMVVIPTCGLVAWGFLPALRLRGGQVFPHKSAVADLVGSAHGPGSAGRLSALGVSHRKLCLYGAFVRAL